MASGDPGRLVALDLPPGPALLGALDAAWQRGDAVVPLPRGAPDAHLHDLLTRLRPAAVIDESGETPLSRAMPVAPGTALVVATSGSTGSPKGVVLSHDALSHSARASLARLGTTPDDRWLCCLPLDHIAGLQILVRSRAAGRTPVVHPRFDPDAIAADRTATLISLVPTMLHRLLEHGVDLGRFQAILLGGAGCPPDLLERARRAGARIVVTYGMTETGGGCVYDGVPLDDVEVAVGDEGRIRIRGPVLLSGYRGAPDPELDDGWYVTSDLGRWEDGRLVVEGRADDVIITGGENVVAGRVEAALSTHPAVREVTVVGRPDAEWGHRVVAVIVPKGDAPTLEELRAHAAATLPRSALPRELDVRSALPLLGSGKVDRAGLADRTAPAGYRGREQEVATMAEDRAVPPSVNESGERIQSRPAGSDFARLPAEETHPREPGGGPHGTVSSGRRNHPLVLVAVGFLIIFTAFGLDTWWPVALGILLILVGGVWGGVRSRNPAPDLTLSEAGDPGVADSDPAADREPAGRQAHQAEAASDPDTTGGATAVGRDPMDQAPPTT